MCEKCYKNDVCKFKEKFQRVEKEILEHNTSVEDMSVHYLKDDTLFKVQIGCSKFYAEPVHIR